MRDGRRMARVPGTAHDDHGAPDLHRSFEKLLLPFDSTSCMSALAAAATTSYAGSRRHDHDTSCVLLPPFYHFLPSSLICMATFFEPWSCVTASRPDLPRQGLIRSCFFCLMCCGIIAGSRRVGVKVSLGLHCIIARFPDPWRHPVGRHSSADAFWDAGHRFSRCIGVPFSDFPRRTPPKRRPPWLE